MPSSLGPTPIPTPLLGLSSALYRAVNLCHLYARQARPVALVGPPGVGADAFAWLLHELSGRSGRFVTAALDEVDPGATADPNTDTSARECDPAAPPVVLRRAAGGTLYLDGLARSSHQAQRRVLRLLEGSRTAALAQRLVVGSEQPLDELVSCGVLLPELRRTIGPRVIPIPPLAERWEDIPVLAHHYLTRLRARLGGAVAARISAVAMRRLMSYPWPENLAELEQAIEEAVARAGRAAVLEPEHFPEPIAALAPAELPFDPGAHQALVSWAIEEAGGRWDEATAMIGLLPQTHGSRPAPGPAPDGAPGPERQ
ncbi:MAG TPA: hypothetical protein VNK43_07050 [Gemmatimonadales bacterium]|nr:hypothetical protein [Gemmatimonadales bacterium]